MINRSFVMASMAGLLCACVTTSPSTRETQTAEVDLASETAGAEGLRPLEEAALPDKSCGMVLWTLEGTRPAAVFRFVSGKQGEVNIAGKPVKLSRTSFDGASGFGVFEHQEFESEEGVVVEVSARFGLSFDGGAYLEQGLIKVRDKNGWSMVSPTAGIAGCKS